jgi:hydrogenase nickel incorporation protein HypB
MFAAAQLMLVNKIDLLPYVQFDVSKCIEYARRVNPGIEVLQVSATRGDGLDAWLHWLLRRRQARGHGHGPHAHGGTEAAPEGRPAAAGAEP